jgi:hypothetical protein
MALAWPWSSPPNGRYIVARPDGLQIRLELPGECCDQRRAAEGPQVRLKAGRLSGDSGV